MADAAGALGLGGEPGAATTTTAATTTATTTPAANDAPAWLTGMTPSAEQTAFLKHKGWYGAENPLLRAVDSISAAEKHLGAPADQILRMPKEGDTEASNAFWQKLGRPEKADGYKAHADAKTVEAIKADPTMAGFDAIAHAANLTQAQRDAMLSAYVTLSGQANTTAEEAFKANGIKAGNELRGEWGAGYEQKMRAVNAAIDKLGFTDDELKAVALIGGHKSLIARLAAAGAGLVEASFRGGEHGGGTGYAGLSPTEARAEIKRLGQDQGFQARLKAKDVATLNQLNQLNRLAAGLDPNG